MTATSHRHAHPITPLLPEWLQGRPKVASTPNQKNIQGRKKIARELTKQVALVALQAGLCAGMLGSISPVW